MDEPEALRTELANGVPIVCAPLPHVHRAVIDLHVRVGPLFESAATSGLSHLLEHMLHRGIPGHPSAHAQALAFEALGASFSAVTYVDHGLLSCSVPPENFEAALALFADVVSAPLFSDLELEKGIIREEILESLDEDGTLVDIDCLVRTLAFPEHPLGFPITVTLDSLNGFDIAAVHEHHREHYASPSVAVTLSGAVDRDRALEAAGKRFSSLARRPAAAAPEAPSQTEPRFRYARRPTSQTALRLAFRAFRAPGERDGDEPATEMLVRLLDDGMSTRLYQRLCDERGLCYDVSATYEPYAHAGLFDLAAESAHENTALVLEQLLSVLRELKEDGPSDAELDKARARVGWQLAEMLDDPDEIAAFYGLGALSGTFKSPAERRAELASVDRARIRGAARRIFIPQGASVVALGRLTRRAQDELQHRLMSL
jgi:predicted Zn-dependent peptidase